MRAIQLKCYYTGREAPEADRIRIQAVIDRLTGELDGATETERNSLLFRIGVLKGNYRPLRA